jgi:citrate synthase
MPVISKGLEGIVANSTSLSDVLGNEGILIYAGYNINELAGKASYEEIVYLLWHGVLPNRAELDELKSQLRSERELPKGVVSFIKAAPVRANPMDVIRTAVSMLGLYDSGLSAEESRQAPKFYRRAVSITQPRSA